MSMTEVMLLVLVVAAAFVLCGARMLYCGHRPRKHHERRKVERRVGEKGHNGELFRS